ncbi:hypothetical protein E2C01_092397 [Portunus trituberculatus]|uniref:Uncharacterized protein n=1 Tax=Portunus trituberculatus TaxID=210409 RepID=A0A5B7JXN0_PORTR|nr:hypothetical protein [Portunus trituberculatus]
MNEKARLAVQDMPQRSWLTGFLQPLPTYLSAPTYAEREAAAVRVY